MERKRILVGDRHREIAEGLSLLLKLHGYEACAASEGASLLRMASERRPDAVVLDLDLPELDGCEVCRRLRGIPGGNAICIIVLTGWAGPRARASAHAAGSDYYLLKPVSLATLLACFDGSAAPLAASACGAATEPGRTAARET